MAAQRTAAINGAFVAAQAGDQKVTCAENKLTENPLLGTVAAGQRRGIVSDQVLPGSLLRGRCGRDRRYEHRDDFKR